MKRTALAPVLLATIVLLGACSASVEGHSSGPRTIHVKAPKDEARAALALSADGRSRTCFTDPAPTDLAWFEVQWQALADLDSFSFDLVNAKGVRVVGPGYTVPPVNFGGRIDYSGSTTWDSWRAALSDRFLMKSQMDQTFFWAPITDETGLLVLHLRFKRHALTSTGASFDGVRATYKTDDGQRGKVQVATRQVFGAGDDCR